MYVCIYIHICINVFVCEVILTSVLAYVAAVEERPKGEIYIVIYLLLIN